MKLTKIGVVLTTCSLLAACGTVLPLKFGGITREDAIVLAKKEIVRRHLELPADHTVKVEDDTFIGEPDVVPVYDVIVGFRNRRNVNPVYIISVNKSSGAIEHLLDERDVGRAYSSLKDFRRKQKAKGQ